MNKTKLAFNNKIWVVLVCLTSVDKHFTLISDKKKKQKQKDFGRFCKVNWQWYVKVKVKFEVPLGKNAFWVGTGFYFAMVQLQTLQIKEKKSIEKILYLQLRNFFILVSWKYIVTLNFDIETKWDIFKLVCDDIGQTGRRIIEHINLQAVCLSIFNYFVFWPKMITQFSMNIQIVFFPLCWIYRIFRFVIITYK